MKRIMAYVLMMAGVLSLAAQTPNPALNDIIESYVPWNSVEFNGKLKYEKLPVTPTLKMYMERDSLIQVSLRAPLMGEVGRLTLTPKELLVVNKMNKTYCREDATRLLDLYPTMIGDIQNLFLARVTVLGQGELGYDNAEMITLDPDGNGNWMVVPQTEPGLIPFNYGYVVGANSRTLAFLATMAKKGSVTVKYSYENRGEKMEVTVDHKDRQHVFDFDFNSVKWGGSPIAPLRLEPYRKISLQEFFSILK